MSNAQKEDYNTTKQHYKQATVHNNKSLRYTWYVFPPNVDWFNLIGYVCPIALTLVAVGESDVSTGWHVKEYSLSQPPIRD